MVKLSSLYRLDKRLSDFEVCRFSILGIISELKILLRRTGFWFILNSDIALTFKRKL